MQTSSMWMKVLYKLCFFTMPLATYRKLPSNEKDAYRETHRQKVEKARRKFISDHLSAQEFETVYSSEFDNVLTAVASLRKERFEGDLRKLNRLMMCQIYDTF